MKRALIVATLTIATLTAQADEPRKIVLSPANGNSFRLSADSNISGACEVRLSKPKTVTVLSETDSTFEIEFEQALNGCWWDSVWNGLDTKRGFISKDQVVWQEEKLKEVPVVIKSIEPENDAISREEFTQSCAPLSSIRPKRRPENLGEGLESEKKSGFEDLMSHLRFQQPGFKSPEQIDQYLKCYPYGLDGLNGYKKYSPYVDLAADVFRVEIQDKLFEVHPSLMRCLLRRESGFRSKATSYTDAVGLGQHTDINIKDIGRLINIDGSWEQKLWRDFFARVKKTKSGATLLANCMGSSKTDRPVFENEKDAACPLQSIAAASIYNLLIQRSLMVHSNSQEISSADELQYQLAIAAAYNLGHGAAGEAVEGKSVSKWIDSIVDKSAEGQTAKKAEVTSHIRAIGRCLQEGNWKPMNDEDQAVCENIEEISATNK